MGPMLRFVVLASASILALACAAGKDSQLTGGSGSGSSSGGGSPTSNSTGVGGGLGPGGGGGGPPLVTEVYGHGADTLYKLNPVTKEVTVVGNFNGCSSVIDIAIDKDSNIFGTSFAGLHAIDRNTAACSLISGSANYPNSLSFVPEGTVYPNTEALVGYFTNQYVAIDTTSGAITTIGSLSGGYSSSGDIVSVINGGTYLTVNGPGCGDCLIEVNPTTGDLVKEWGPLGYGSVFGIAFWGGTAYGFSNDGDLFSITFAQNSVTTTPISIPNAPSNLSFWGAGSSTAVPLVPPE